MAVKSLVERNYSYGELFERHADDPLLYIVSGSSEFQTCYISETSGEFCLFCFVFKYRFTGHASRNSD